jgi:hypothetical protein
MPTLTIDQVEQCAAAFHIREIARNTPKAVATRAVYGDRRNLHDL